MVSSIGVIVWVVMVDIGRRPTHMKTLLSINALFQPLRFSVQQLDVSKTSCPFSPSENHYTCVRAFEVQRTEFM